MIYTSEDVKAWLADELKQPMQRMWLVWICEEYLKLLETQRAEVAAPNLPFVVEYRRKPENQYRGFGSEWVPMAAFDVEGAAEAYAKSCSAGDPPWEYQVRNAGPAPR